MDVPIGVPAGIPVTVLVGTIVLVITGIEVAVGAAAVLTGARVAVAIVVAVAAGVLGTTGVALGATPQAPPQVSNFQFVSTVPEFPTQSFPDQTRNTMINTTTVRIVTPALSQVGQVEILLLNHLKIIHEIHPMPMPMLIATISPITTTTI